MATKADFTAEEWDLIVFAPLTAAVIVLGASPSGPVGIVQELLAMGVVLAEAGKQPDKSALVGAILQELTERKGQSIQDAPAQLQNVQDPLRELLPTLRDAATAVGRKAPDEAEPFKALLLQVANRVAEAAKEGGFLGFGGVKVNDQERAAIEAITVAFDEGISAGQTSTSVAEASAALTDQPAASPGGFRSSADQPLSGDDFAANPGSFEGKQG